MNYSLRLAFCSVIAALGVTVMILTAILPGMTYALPALAGILLIAIVSEVGTGWAFSVYAVEAVLSVLLAANVEAVLSFLLFFGYYPILKAVLEKRIHGKFSQAVVKLLVFNASALLEFWLSVNILGIPSDSFVVFGVSVPWLFLLLGNAVFIVYDYAVSLLVFTYFSRLHPVIKKWFRLK